MSGAGWSPCRSTPPWGLWGAAAKARARAAERAAANAEARAAARGGARRDRRVATEGRRGRIALGGFSPVAPPRIELSLGSRTLRNPHHSYPKARDGSKHHTVISCTRRLPWVPGACGPAKRALRWTREGSFPTVFEAQRKRMGPELLTR